MVINGTTEGVGSERLSIGPMIKAAEDAKALHQHVGIARSVDGRARRPCRCRRRRRAATLWLVGFDREHATPVLHGENEGHTLKEYQVVRSFAAVGTWRGQALDLTVAADASRPATAASPCCCSRAAPAASSARRC